MSDLVERVCDVIDEMAFEARAHTEIARAIIPLVLEEAAKKARNEAFEEVTDSETAHYNRGVAAAVEAIRALGGGCK